MTPAEELKIIFSKHRWAAEELAYDQKQQEATALCNGSSNAMFAYLKERYGSTAAVLGMLRSLVRLQDGRRKTLVKEK